MSIESAEHSPEKGPKVNKFDDRGKDDPGRVVYLRSYSSDGKLVRDHVIRRDNGKIETTTE